MKILIVCQYYYPEQFLINEIAESLVLEGNEVTVLTGLPNYPKGDILADYRHGKKRDEVINGVHVIRCGIIGRGHSKIHLLLNYCSFAVSGLRKSRKLREKYDVVFSYQLTPITQVYPAIDYAHRNGLKLFMYNCDLAPMSGEKTIGSGCLSRLYAKIAKNIMKQPDKIGVTSESFIEYNHRVNDVPLDKMIYMPQHASDRMMNINMESVDNGITDFMFAGNIAKGTNLDLIVKSSIELKKKNLLFKVHIVGDGSYLPMLKQLVKENELEECFVFHGRFTMDEMPNIYKYADALLITLRKGQITVPSKLQTYMTTGKPIFGAMDGSGQEIMNNSKCGKCVDAGDYIGLANVMEEYITYPERFVTCGANAREYFALNFTKECYMRKLNLVFNELVSDKKGI